MNNKRALTPPNIEASPSAPTSGSQEIKKKKKPRWRKKKPTQPAESEDSLGNVTRALQENLTITAPDSNVAEASTSAAPGEIKKSARKRRNRKNKKKAELDAAGPIVLADAEVQEDVVTKKSPQKSSKSSKKQDKEHKPKEGKKFGRDRRSFFDAHLPEADWGNEDLIEGQLRVNKRKRDLAFISIDKFENDIIVYGKTDQNRALDGDTVLVKIIGHSTMGELEDFRSGTKRFKQSKLPHGPKSPVVNAEDGIGNDNESVNDDDAEKAVVHPIGVVVAIKERRPGHLYDGVLMPADWDMQSKRNQDENSAEGNSNKERKTIPRQIFFKPTQKSVPLMVVDLHGCPKDFVENPEKYKTTIFLCSFVKWSEGSRYPLGRIKKMMGEAGQVDVESRTIIEANGIRDQEFSHNVLNCLPSNSWEIPESEFSVRRDMRKECIYTIDPETARDLDDALSCKALGDGLYEVGVHIADVSHFVKYGTKLDEEARSRATTTYLVQKAITMLPSVLSENLCSLNPNVDRLAFSVVWVMDDEGNIKKSWFGKTVIRSCVKMSYEIAQKLIDGVEWKEIYPEFTPEQPIDAILANLRVFHKISKCLRKKRFDNGALTLNRSKLTFRLDEKGEPIFCSIYELRDTNRMIEEFMLLANMSVAKEISSNFPEMSLLRCHPQPNQKKMDWFNKLAQTLGQPIASSSSLELQTSMDQVKDPKMQTLLYSALVRTMQRAKYFCTGDSPVEEGKWSHYALNVEMYTHFTSPIRRYADIIVHRLLFAVIQNKRTDDLATSSQVHEIAKQCNLKKEDARAAQDASSMLFFCLFLNRYEKLAEKPVHLKAIVIELGEKFAVVYVSHFGIEKRVYFEDAEDMDAVTVVNESTIEVSWKDASDKFTISLLDEIMVHVFVRGQLPMEVRANLLKPGTFDPEETDMSKLLGGEVSKSCLLEEIYEDET